MRNFASKDNVKKLAYLSFLSFFGCLTFSLLTIGFYVIPYYVTADAVQRLSLSAWAVVVVVYCPPPTPCPPPLLETSFC